MRILKCVVAAALLSITTIAFAWDGSDQQTGDSVEIESGNLVRSGSDIQYYDYGRGEYVDATVEGIQRFGGTVEVEVYDMNSGEYRTLEFNDADQ